MKEAKQISRRQFLNRAVAVGGAAIAAPVLLSACGGGEEAAAPKALSCLNPPGLTAQEKGMRETLAYVEKSMDPSKACELCNFYTVPAKADSCGGCTLNLGPVNPKGSCNSFVAKVAG